MLECLSVALYENKSKYIYTLKLVNTYPTSTLYHKLTCTYNTHPSVITHTFSSQWFIPFLFQVPQWWYSNQIASCDWCHVRGTKKARQLKHCADDYIRQNQRTDQWKMPELLWTGRVCFFLNLAVWSCFKCQVGLSRDLLRLTGVSSFVSLHFMVFRSRAPRKMIPTTSSLFTALLFQDLHDVT